jgi:FtsP/CotA-like multicopper oxidase with cupredoxin domain
VDFGEPLAGLFCDAWPEAVPRFLSVNGQREPAIRMQPGEVQRWRIIHAGHENNLHIALEKHILHVIAFDGIRRSQVGHFQSLLMAPGQRADVLVQAGAIGTYAFRAIANDQGYLSPVGALAQIIVEGEPLPMPLVAGKRIFFTPISFCKNAITFLASADSAAHSMPA